MNKTIKTLTLLSMLTLPVFTANAVPNNPSPCAVTAIQDITRWKDGHIKPAAHYVKVKQMLPIPESPVFTMYIMDSWSMGFLMPTKDKSNSHIGQSLDSLVEGMYIGRAGTYTVTDLSGRNVKKDIWIEMNDEMMNNCNDVEIWPVE